MFEAIFKYQFLQNAVISCLLASVVCGIIGVIIVEKKLLMMSGGIAHTAYGGVGLGYLCGFEPIFGAIGFSVLAAFGIGFMRKKGGASSDVIIALFWSLGMALGIAFIGMMPGYPPDLNSYLFGNILSVTMKDLKMMAVMAGIVCVVIITFFNDWKSYLFDEEFAKIIGLKTTFFDYLLLVLTSLTVVVLIRVAGIILILALLTAPAATASLLSEKLLGRIIYSIFFGAVFCLLGLWISYIYNIPSGATIILLSVAIYSLVAVTKYLINKPKHEKILTSK